MKITQYIACMECVTLALLLLMVGGCDERSLPETSGCDLYSTRVCTCMDGTQGTQLCENGISFSSCQCAGIETVNTSGEDGWTENSTQGPPVSGSSGSLALETEKGEPATSGSGSPANAAGATGGVAGLNSVGGSAGIASDAGVYPGEGEPSGDAGEAGEASEPSEGVEELDLFSFFVTSMEAMQRLSGSSNGFGGDLRYGEEDGLSGADKICTEIAESSMPGASAKRWRAFISATKGGPDGGPVNAIDRIGTGPWYDRLGRLVALNPTDLANPRPVGADPTIINDLPNEYGIPNHDPDVDGIGDDNHHILTGSDAQGYLFDSNPLTTCQDWTSSVGTDGRPRVGMSWPRSMGGSPGGGFFPRGGGGPGDESSTHWISSFNEAGCAALINIIQDGPGDSSTVGVGTGGGYGGIYCFALTP